MISISVYRNSDKVVRQFIIEGHAYAADPGEDVVCAAVSVLGQTTVLSLYHIANIDIKHKIKKGYLKCELPDSLTDGQLYDSKLLIDNMLLGLKNLQESYSQYINICDKEV